MHDNMKQTKPEPERSVLNILLDDIEPYWAACAGWGDILMFPHLHCLGCDGDHNICSPGRGSTRHTTTLGCLNIHMDTVRNTQNLESQESCLLATFDGNIYSYSVSTL